MGNPLIESLLMVAAVAVLLVIVVRTGGLRRLFAPKFEPRPLLNTSERRLYYMLRKELPRGWMVMAQVSYGAFLSNRSAKRYWTINAKRADLVVLDPSLRVAAVVEYQGRGHYGSDARGRSRARKSDRIKRRAIGAAGITFLEIPARFDQECVRKLVRRVVMAESVSESPLEYQSSKLFRCVPSVSTISKSKAGRMEMNASPPSSIR